MSLVSSSTAGGKNVCKFTSHSLKYRVGPMKLSGSIRVLSRSELRRFTCSPVYGSTVKRVRSIGNWLQQRGMQHLL